MELRCHIGGLVPQKLTLVPFKSGLDGVSQELASDFEGTILLIA
jgi:hypothetical protein